QPGPAGFTAAPRRVYARLYADAQKAEFGATQGRPRAPDERDRGHNVHSRRRPQPAGALDCADPRRPRERPPRRSLSRGARHPGCNRRREPQAEEIEVRSEETEVRQLPEVTIAKESKLKTCCAGGLD